MPENLHIQLQWSVENLQVPQGSPTTSIAPRWDLYTYLYHKSCQVQLLQKNVFKQKTHVPHLTTNSIQDPSWVLKRCLVDDIPMFLFIICWHKKHLQHNMLWIVPPLPATLANEGLYESPNPKNVIILVVTIGREPTPNSHY